MFQSPTHSEEGNDSVTSVSPLSAHSDDEQHVTATSIPEHYRFPTGTSMDGPIAGRSHGGPGSATKYPKGTPNRINYQPRKMQQHYDPSEVFPFLVGPHGEGGSGHLHHELDDEHQQQYQQYLTAEGLQQHVPPAKLSGNVSVASRVSSVRGASTSQPHSRSVSIDGMAHVYESERSLPLNLSAIAHGDSLMDPARSPENVARRLLEMQKSTRRGASKGGNRSSAASSTGTSYIGRDPHFSKTRDEMWMERIENLNRLRDAQQAKKMEDIQYMKAFKKMARDQKKRDEEQRIAAAARNRSASRRGITQPPRAPKPQQGQQHGADGANKRNALTTGDIQAYFDAPAFQKKLKLLPANPVLGQRQQQPPLRDRVGEHGESAPTISAIPESRLDLHFAKATQRYE